MDLKSGKLVLETTQDESDILWVNNINRRIFNAFRKTDINNEGFPVELTAMETLNVIGKLESRSANGDTDVARQRAASLLGNIARLGMASRAETSMLDVLGDVLQARG